ncbi:ATP-binding cassette domain-containing protein [Streptomyces sp. NBC_00347]|uniref:ATP-binding cassette domain-containing protein n=1 Tax=Streptomyces sp. NBC_00347 TaxID=2975721 RepID=UPI0022510149|nr:ATP-binding cassette domain-containing protein [Streptomyces sp. NBC_00347]MCX5126741.1 ATP-binding cassette domain-containing protein [Streptomyces sp. NBC_00347]
MLTMTSIGKKFPGAWVLRDVDLDVAAGGVHALIGENGAGKSTLMKILAGVHVPDEGTVEIDGRIVRLGHPLDAQRAGVSVVYQESNLLPERTVAESVFHGREPARRGLVDRAAGQLTTADLVRLMVGRELADYSPPCAVRPPGATLLSVRGGGNDTLDDIDLDLCAGEVVGPAGLQGEGRTELAKALLRRNLPFFEVLAAPLTAIAVANPYFLEPSGFPAFAKRAVPLAILATGQYFVVVSGEFDLPVGSLVTAEVVAAAALIAGDPEATWSVLLLLLILGVVVGLANGLVRTTRSRTAPAAHIPAPSKG